MWSDRGEVSPEGGEENWEVWSRLLTGTVVIGDPHHGREHQRDMKLIRKYLTGKYFIR